MASIWKHPKSRYFTACFRDENGKQRRIATKEMGRKKAQNIAEEYETASRTKRTLRQTQAAIERLHKEVSGEIISRATLRQYVESWLVEKKPTTAPSTLGFYRGPLRKFVEATRPKSASPTPWFTNTD